MASVFRRRHRLGRGISRQRLISLWQVQIDIGAEHADGEWDQLADHSRMVGQCLDIAVMNALQQAATPDAALRARLLPAMPLSSLGALVR